MGELREKKSKHTGTTVMLTVLAFVFIGIPIAHSSTDDHGRSVYNTAWSEEKNGIVTTIDQVKIYRTEKNIDEGFDNELSVSVKIENTTGHSIYATPEEGKLVIGKIQMNANTDASDKIGREILSGAVSEGTVRYQLKEDINIRSIKKIRLSWPQSDEKVKPESNDITINLAK
ncbi:hypothetical protein [Bacillus sp. V5-8f]|uniref:hypothetical protein n=1 Tax=Bacillus sp. V5-8f TaxID=2053044 RepID=UPI000C75DD93|nr:hypothetical protein [Bacillus sp. V5-8f]PLT35602.1 hypothetical protein CUU64_03075 [Bacillus sp. V5-8f]